MYQLVTVRKKSSESPRSHTRFHSLHWSCVLLYPLVLKILSFVTLNIFYKQNLPRSFSHSFIPRHFPWSQIFQAIVHFHALVLLSSLFIITKLPHPHRTSATYITFSFSFISQRSSNSPKCTQIFTYITTVHEARIETKTKLLVTIRSKLLPSTTLLYLEGCFSL